MYKTTYDCKFLLMVPFPEEFSPLLAMQFGQNISPI